MKNCPNCNAVLQDEQTLCPACGAQTMPTQAPQAPVYYAPPAPQEQPVSVGGWIGRSLIPCIPFVGSIIYLIMLFIWMGDKTKQETFRNWAKAQLIVLLIVVGLGVLLAVLFGGVLAAVFANAGTGPSLYY